MMTSNPLIPLSLSSIPISVTGSCYSLCAQTGRNLTWKWTYSAVQARDDWEQFLTWKKASTLFSSFLTSSESTFRKRWKWTEKQKKPIKNKKQRKKFPSMRIWKINSLFWPGWRKEWFRNCHAENQWRNRTLLISWVFKDKRKRFTSARTGMEKTCLRYIKNWGLTQWILRVHKRKTSTNDPYSLTK